MFIYFIRHPESINNTLGLFAKVNDDSSLSVAGLQQKQKILEYLQQHYQISKVFSSELLRSRELGEQLSDGLRTEFITHDGLKERQWGEFGDLPWTQVQKKLAVMNIDERYEFEPKEGESRKNMERRLLKSLHTIIESSDEHEQIAIITHKGCLRSLLPTLLGIPKEMHESYSVALGSITILEYKDNQFSLVELNITDHL